MVVRCLVGYTVSLCSVLSEHFLRNIKRTPLGVLFCFDMLFGIVEERISKSANGKEQTGSEDADLSVDETAM